MNNKKVDKLQQQISNLEGKVLTFNTTTNYIVRGEILARTKKTIKKLLSKNNIYLNTLNIKALIGTVCLDNLRVYINTEHGIIKASANLERIEACEGNSKTIYKLTNVNSTSLL